MAKANAPKDSGDTELKIKIPGEEKSISPARLRLQIAQAYLHQAVLIPQAGITEKHLGKTGHPFTLEWGPEGLWVIPNDKTKPTSITPHANVALAVLK